MKSSSVVTLESRFPEIIAELPVKMDKVAEVGAKLVEATAKEKVPVDSGDLRDAIHTEKEGSGKYAVIAGDDESWYGMLVEHGTSHSAPQPFLVPALEENKPIVVTLVEAAIRSIG